ncbi:hypothetical protein [Roseiconus lacunae]|uniref:Uncharacterized protein n=1 Tax=Roseiconus lacunae TaxID=2605694 RepID=A0ABT7PHM9_9BACT|nr:hypothetical protein [Roseiconus lacunae]MDM4015995.1 hypothetical protein [Roseiconus lacunae]
MTTKTSRSAASRSRSASKQSAVDAADGDNATESAADRLSDQISPADPIAEALEAKDKRALARAIVRPFLRFALFMRCRDSRPVAQIAVECKQAERFILTGEIEPGATDAAS